MGKHVKENISKHVETKVEHQLMRAGRDGTGDGARTDGSVRRGGWGAGAHHVFFDLCFDILFDLCFDILLDLVFDKSFP